MHLTEAVLPFPNLDPVALHIWGPLVIRWYALAYVVGLVLGWWGVLLLLRRKRLWAAPPFNGKPPATEDQIGDLVVWMTFGVILGGRLGWDLIYGTILCSVSPDAEFCRGMPMAFVTDPIKLIAAWEGGMSFHGGLLGVILAIWLFCRRNKLNLLAVADLVALVAPIGLFFGRIANFVNGELWGRVSDVPWAMVFPRAGLEPRHPSQLYEAASEGILLFIILQVCLALGLHRRPGLLTAIFFLGYGTFRFICEFFREPDAPFLGPVSMGMALSIPVWLTAGALFVLSFKTPLKKAA
jgi:phosphatidylglycerol:prolipoprotein diacylglycerol transferase